MPHREIRSVNELPQEIQDVLRRRQRLAALRAIDLSTLTVAQRIKRLELLILEADHDGGL